jgi:hypothetical protein
MAHVVRWTAAGLTVGATYGAALRAWMRPVSTDPEFSWGGTGYIIGVFSVLGAMAGAGIRRSAARLGPATGRAARRARRGCAVFR